MGWEAAGKAWGMRAWDWALLTEPTASNSFDLLQQLTGVGDGVRLLDVACGSGLALQRAHARGAVCFGIDASEALLAVAAERAPGVSLTLGDTADLPYEDDFFDVVTCVNGVQYGSEQTLVEVARVLRAGGRFGMSFWSDARDFGPFFRAVESCSPPAASPSTPLQLSDPGVSEGLAESAGLEVHERGDHEVVALFRSIEDAICGLEAPGHTVAAIEHSGREALRAAIREAVQPYVHPASGRVRMAATWGHLTARLP